ncbi:hypothetical protein [Stenotrophomonas sp. 278]|uniref:hypothetical protein n=1 Tax=Stenotrophomonas sp. 278 TaxID=2479851 RepID=UPI000F65C857|nr:hypothetical protein [Stenotrophomonas sp. 278]RRU18864.1 hypothetical protein EGJ34_06220 [Stenotrophomonas sp. 278]
MPVTDANQDRLDAHEFVLTIPTIVSRYPPKPIADMAREDVQIGVAKIVERAIVLQNGYTIAAQLVLEQSRHVLWPLSWLAPLAAGQSPALRQ